MDKRDGLAPACAMACPTQSIHFGPIDELREVRPGEPSPPNFLFARYPPQASQNRT